MTNHDPSLLETIHWKRRQQYKANRELLRTVFVSEFDKGVLPKEEIEDIALEMDLLDILSDQAMDAMVESWSRNEQHRLYLLERLINSRDLMFAQLQKVSPVTTDVEDRAYFVSVTVEDVGSNAPPRPVHRLLKGRPRTIQCLRNGGPRTIHRLLNGGPPI
jgi:L-2-hydroxyglutarate oxidase LhgO